MNYAGAKGKAMAETIRIQVLLTPQDARRFEDYCRDRGFKKSTLIARLLREHLDREGFPSQPDLFSLTESRPKE